MAQLFPPDWAEMPIKVTYQNPGLEYDENMACKDFLNMGMLPLEQYARDSGQNDAKSILQFYGPGKAPLTNYGNNSPCSRAGVAA